MKKYLLMLAAVISLTACGGDGEKTENNGEEANKTEALQFSVANGISGTTGSKNCHLVELGAPIAFEVAENGENMDVTAKITLTHSDKTEVDEGNEKTELWISGREDDSRDIKVTLAIDEESKAKLTEFLKKGKGEQVEVVFKGTAPKADLEKLNGKQTTNTLVL